MQPIAGFRLASQDWELGTSEVQDPSRFSGLRFTISGNFRPGIKQLHIMYHSALIKSLPEASHEWETFGGVQRT
jgi:hypothetical protein